MTKLYDFEIPGLPKMANGSHGHWSTKYKERKFWKSQVALSLLGKLPKTAYPYLKVIFTRYSSSEPDDDGLTHGFKPIRDALVECGLVPDDSRKYLSCHYRWEKSKPKLGKIRIEVFLPSE